MHRYPYVIRKSIPNDVTPIPGHPEEDPHTHQERRKSAWPRHGHRPRSGPRVIGHDADARFWRRLCRRGPQQRGDGQRRDGGDDPAPTGPDGRDDQGAHRRAERAVESEERLARLPRWHIRHPRPLRRRRGPHQHERGLRQYGDRGRPRSKALRAPRTRPGENRHRVYPRFSSPSRSLARRYVADDETLGAQVSVHHDMVILSMVGKQMRNMVGIAGRMFTTLAQGNVNIEMISQGANEINISCVLDGRDAIKALNLIHQSCLQIKPEGPKGRGPYHLYI